jgi:hypothetical protein
MFESTKQMAPAGLAKECSERRTYVAPALVEYGSVAKLTQTGGMTGNDFFIFRQMGMSGM